MPSSRATIAAGTRPPRVIATTALKGPVPLKRQARARASRWNWSHDTGKLFCHFSSICAPPKFPRLCRARKPLAIAFRNQRLLHHLGPDSPDKLQFPGKSMHRAGGQIADLANAFEIANVEMLVVALPEVEVVACTRAALA